MELSDVAIAGIFTLIGAIIQSVMSSRNDKKIVGLQTKKEIEKLRYFEKEKLYSDIISFLPQLALSYDAKCKKINLSKENIIKMNSFKARLGYIRN